MMFGWEPYAVCAEVGEEWLREGYEAGFRCQGAVSVLLISYKAIARVWGTDILWVP